MNYQGVFGYDISTYQDSPDITGTVDFTKMAGTAAKFCIFRASIGDSPDADYYTYWKNSKGLLHRAAYHYYLMNYYPPKTQALRFWNTIKADPPYRVVLDCEEGVVGDWAKWYDFLEEFKRLSGYTSSQITIYTGFSIWTSVISGATAAQKNYFAQYSLWLAWYFPQDPLHPNYSIVKIPSPWTDYIMLQSGTPAIGLWAGVESKEIDYDQFNGDENAMRSFFGLTQPPQTGETGMFYGKMKANLTNIRTGTSINYADVGDLFLNDLIEADRKQLANGVNWWHLTKITRADGTNYPLPAPDCWCWETNVTELPPPVSTPASMDITLAPGSVVTVKDGNGKVLYTTTA